MKQLFAKALLLAALTASVAGAVSASVTEAKSCCAPGAPCCKEGSKCCE